ncbi:hypothetical protein AVEN_126880-1 [Araneus ventricosus]|uniref:Uncharacterized protein n=1 Tax=Araneus ventricosus TaxID=182803 RepID=A0A4Y2C0Q4_ARAVE|nr:hypothetical protein AVEN_126880-1 [Araneus ventricosus]
MSSKNKTNPSELLTDSPEESSFLDSNSEPPVTTSVAGTSVLRSPNYDDVNCIDQDLDQDLKAEYFNKYFNPFTYESTIESIREPCGELFVSFHNLCQFYPSLPLDESANIIKAKSENDKYGQEADQLKEMPNISSCSTAYEESCWADFSPSICSSSGDNVPKRERSDIKMAGVLEEIDNLNRKKLKMECAGNGEDSRYFEQSKFETPENCNLSDHPLNSENKSLHKQLDPEQNTILSGAILSQNTMTRNDV